jgi:hypothetical protein
MNGAVVNELADRCAESSIQMHNVILMALQLLADVKNL